MKFGVCLNDGAGEKLRSVEIERNSATWRVTLDGQSLDADAIEIDPHTISILLDGRSYVLQVTQPAGGTLKLQTALREFTAEVADPRAWRGRSHSAHETQGRQQVVAPMPGKVVRVLVRTGDGVEKGQGLVVVEAMKMQNEIRSPKSGIVERLTAQEGQAVNAGEALCVIS